jgi:ABC-type glycerol-3-phosphate transport system permease component
MTDLPYMIASALLATLPVAAVLLLLVRVIRRAVG